MARPAWPLSSIETRTPARLPATFATWFSVSETANADDRISSPISRCTVESSDSLASPAASAAVNATAMAASRLKNQAHTAVTIGASGEHGEQDEHAGPGRGCREPIAIAARPPAAAAATRPPSAKLCDTLKCAAAQVEGEEEHHVAGERAQHRVAPHRLAHHRAHVGQAPPAPAARRGPAPAGPGGCGGHAFRAGRRCAWAAVRLARAGGRLERDGPAVPDRVRPPAGRHRWPGRIAQARSGKNPAAGRRRPVPGWRREPAASPPARGVAARGTWRRGRSGCPPGAPRRPRPWPGFPPPPRRRSWRRSG